MKVRIVPKTVVELSTSCWAICSITGIGVGVGVTVGVWAGVGVSVGVAVGVGVFVGVLVGAGVGVGSTTSTAKLVTWQGVVSWFK